MVINAFRILSEYFIQDIKNKDCKVVNFILAIVVRAQVTPPKKSGICDFLFIVQIFPMGIGLLMQG